VYNPPAMYPHRPWLAIGGGGPRTGAEYAALLGAAGFQLSGVVPTATEHSVIEAVPA
jgi:hypothetical protein